MNAMERKHRSGDCDAKIPQDVRERRKGIRWNTKIYVCSPYRPTSEDPKEAEREQADNVIRAALACRLVAAIGYHPLCPHLYFTNFFRDEKVCEREKGMCLALDWLIGADEVWVFGDEISEGMQEELETARRWDIPIRYMAEPALMVMDMMAFIRGTDYAKRWAAHPEETDAEVFRKVYLGEEG